MPKSKIQLQVELTFVDQWHARFYSQINKNTTSRDIEFPDIAEMFKSG